MAPRVELNAGTSSSSDQLVSINGARGEETPESKPIIANNNSHTPTPDNQIGSTNELTSSMYQIPLGSMGYGSQMGMYGQGGFGYGGGMYGGGMYGGNMIHGAGGMGPMNGLNQFLFSIQSVMFSLTQAIQIVSMNTQTFNQLLESTTTLLDHAIETFQEMRTMDAISQELETEEQRKRRKRLKALRWAFVTAATYASYKLLRRVFGRRPGQPRPRLAVA